MLTLSLSLSCPCRATQQGAYIFLALQACDYAVTRYLSTDPSTDKTRTAPTPEQLCSIAAHVTALVEWAATSVEQAAATLKELRTYLVDVVDLLQSLPEDRGKLCNIKALNEQHEALRTQVDQLAAAPMQAPVPAPVLAAAPAPLLDQPPELPDLAPPAPAPALAPALPVHHAPDSPCSDGCAGSYSCGGEPVADSLPPSPDLYQLGEVAALEQVTMLMRTLPGGSTSESESDTHPPPPKRARGGGSAAVSGPQLFASGVAHTTAAATNRLLSFGNTDLWQPALSQDSLPRLSQRLRSGYLPPVAPSRPQVDIRPTKRVEEMRERNMAPCIFPGHRTNQAASKQQGGTPAVPATYLPRSHALPPPQPPGPARVLPPQLPVVTSTGKFVRRLTDGDQLERLRRRPPLQRRPLPPASPAAGAAVAPPPLPPASPVEDAAAEGEPPLPMTLLERALFECRDQLRQVKRHQIEPLEFSDAAEQQPVIRCSLRKIYDALKDPAVPPLLLHSPGDSTDPAVLAGKRAAHPIWDLLLRTNWRKGGYVFGAGMPGTLTPGSDEKGVDTLIAHLLTLPAEERAWMQQGAAILDPGCGNFR